MHYKQNHPSIIVSLTFIGLFVAAITGWIMNIIELCQSTAFSGMVIARIIGVFMAPLGAVLGYF